MGQLFWYDFRTRPVRTLSSIMRRTTVFRFAGFPLIFLLACAKPPAEKAESRPVPVRVVRAVKKTVPVRIQTIGTVKAAATVALRPRVSGQLTDVFFKEGESVTKDQKLIGIDPRPYQTAVRQAEATLAKSQALYDGALLDLRRVEQVGTGGAAAAIELDTARTAAASAKAVVELDRASLESAKLQLSFTTIVSPLDGRVGELLVNQGNLVDATGVTPLVVINQVSPIFVTFALPEAQLPAVAAARRIRPLRVEAQLRDGEPPISGALAFIDNAVNVGSGTVQLKAEFPNLDRKLWPGQFVDVVLTVADRPDSVVVPLSAVQSGQKGSYVYAVTADGKAELRVVTVAFESGADAVIATGLKGDETVVIDGQLRLTNGTPVRLPAVESASVTGAKQ
jgi:multidrug efflux system membrane fusion protein